ncbi:MAG: FAD:protein FMN transferase [Bacteroidetes bacterium]|nr:FAD:protein FMN transferase [Bacteroidota bacterium]
MKTNLFIIFILTLTLNGCQKNAKYIYNKGFAYGTMYSIIYQSPNGKDYQEEITEKFQEYTMIFSPYEAESTISKVNRNENAKLEPVFITCFERAMEISKITNGAFDITAGSLVNAWGFGPDERKKMTPEIVESLKLITGYKKIQIKNKKILKENPEIKLDMNAISKGFTSDLLASFLKEKGCKNYMVEIGGEVVAKGKNAKRKIWTIGISKPAEDILVSTSDLQAKIQLPDLAMATSGNYRNFYVEDGKKYAHTIDPKTGYPVQHSLLSTTVLAKDCMTADAFATAFMVLGMDLGVEVARLVPEIEIYFIYADEQGNNQVYMSEGFGQYLVK